MQPLTLATAVDVNWQTAAMRAATAALDLVLKRQLWAGSARGRGRGQRAGEGALPADSDHSNDAKRKSASTRAGLSWLD